MHAHSLTLIATAEASFSKTRTRGAAELRAGEEVFVDNEDDVINVDDGTKRASSIPSFGAIRALAALNGARGAAAFIVE